MQKCLFLTFLVIPIFVQAEVYKSVAPDGSAVFTDKPHTNGQAIEIPKTQTYSSPKPSGGKQTEGLPATNSKPAPATLAGEAQDSIPHLTITTPKQDEVIWSAEGSITVIIQMTPELDANEGHTATVLVDGKQATEASNAQQFILQEIDRGTHTLEAIIQDRNGAILSKSNPVTVHIKRPSVLLRRNP